MNEREERISLRADRAKRIFLGGANCAESIWQAFSEGLDQDEQALGNCLASGFGGAGSETFVGPLPGHHGIGTALRQDPGQATQ